VATSHPVHGMKRWRWGVSNERDAGSERRITKTGIAVTAAKIAHDSRLIPNSGKMDKSRPSHEILRPMVLFQMFYLILAKN
jgi:hypothetical protein